MTKALTVRGIETLQPSETRREIADGLLRGLYLIQQPSGAKSWAVRYRHAGRTRKLTLGAYPRLTLAEARELGAAALRSASEGHDPGQAKAQERVDTIEATVADFIERHCRRSNKPRTAEETERLFKLHVIPAWKGRTIQSITRRDVLDLIDGVVDAGTPIAANRVLTALKTLFTWAVGRGVVTASPCAAVKKPAPERSRDRVLSDPELRTVWKAAETIGGPFGALVRVLILTGQRRDECARIMWAEIDREARIWTLPAARAKNRRVHAVHLSAPVLAIIDAQPRIRDCPFVLTNDGKTAASNYAKGKAALDKLLPPDMPPWVLHDLRRSCASGMARLGVSLPTVEKVLNHLSGSFGGIVSVYQRHDFADEKRDALDLWARHVKGLVEGDSNVISLASRRVP